MDVGGSRGTRQLRRSCANVILCLRATSAALIAARLTPAQADTRRPEPVNIAEYRIRRKQVLGGLTHEYYVAA